MTYVGYYITSDDVKDFLGATYDSTNAKYTIMGALNIDESVFDFQVENSDDVITGFVGQLDTNTGKYLLAKSCALNLASLRVLVVASGGFVTVAAGNVNYRLGDLAISKGEIVKAAVDYAVKNYEARYNEYLLKITSGATRIDSDYSDKYSYDWGSEKP